MQIVTGYWRFRMGKTNNLSQDLSRIEQDLRELKTLQALQNDSSKLYIYRTSNLTWADTQGYGASKKAKVEFISKVEDKNNIICQFLLSDFTAAQYYAQTRAKTSNPLICEADIFGYKSSYPTWRRSAYITCIASCEGELRWSVS